MTKRIFKLNISVIVALLFFYPCIFFSQTFFFQNYTVNEGVVQSNITAIVQDLEGYIWLGTENGVSKIDGKNYYNYSTDDGLADNNIRSIIIDNKNTIWFAHKNGALTRYDNKKFIAIQSKYLPTESDIYSVYQDKKNRLWLSTNKYGAICITNPYGNFSDSTNFISYTGKSGLSAICYSIFEDEENNIWFLTDVGIKILDKKTFQISFFKSNELPPITIYSMFKDKSGNIWLGFINGNISMIDAKTKKIRNYLVRTGLPKISENSNMSIALVNTFAEDNDGNIWAAIWENGIVKINKDHQLSYINSKNGLSSDKIRSLAADREGNLLIGTYGGGLAVYKGERFISFTKNNGLVNNQVNAIIQDTNQNFWFATNEGINMFDTKEKQISTIPNSPKVSIKALATDHNGNIWIGTWGQEVIIYDLRLKKIITNTLVNDYIVDYVSSLSIDKNNNVWIGTNDGLTVYNINNNTVKHFRVVDGLPSNDITCLFADNQNNIWIGTRQDGLAVYRNGKFIHYNKSNGLNYPNISAITQDNNGNIWIGTQGGGLYSLKDNTFKNFKKKNGLNSDFITLLCTDNNNHIWIGTNNGLNKFNYQTNTISSYKQGDGFTAIETKENAAFKDNEGNLWFGTVNGAFKYSFANDKINKIPPVVKITGLKINSKEQEIKDTLDLSYFDNTIMIYYTGICFSNPDAVLYSVKLENSDNNWSEPSTQNFEKFANLTPGSYTLFIKAANNNGVWSNPTQAIHFIIHPPFWKTWWFIALCIISGIIIFFTYVNIRERNLLKEKKILEEKVEERTAEIAKQKKEIETKNEDITASIRYAKRIQDAILPPDEDVKKFLPKTFILFKPKDIVSGDFYWLKDIKEHILFAAVDCTGHGVPGAFMSIVGHNHLDQIVNVQKLIKPSEILDALNKSVSDTLRQTSSDDKVKDGMDIALCAFNRKTNIFEYAGAFNPLYHIRNGVLTETKADKFPIGNLKIGEQKKFTNHEILLEKGDTLYLFSDGFADQFGGEAGKKLKYGAFKKLLLSIQHLSMEEQGDYLQKFIVDWQGKYEQVDDILVIGTRL